MKENSRTVNAIVIDAWRQMLLAPRVWVALTRALRMSIMPRQVRVDLDRKWPNAG